MQKNEKKYWAYSHLNGLLPRAFLPLFALGDHWIFFKFHDRHSHEFNCSQPSVQ